MKTLAVPPVGESRRTGDEWNKLKKAGISVVMGFCMFTLIFILVLLIEKM